VAYGEPRSWWSFRPRARWGRRSKQGSHNHRRTSPTPGGPGKNAGRRRAAGPANDGFTPPSAQVLHSTAFRAEPALSTGERMTNAARGSIPIHAILCAARYGLLYCAGASCPVNRGIPRRAIRGAVYVCGQRRCGSIPVMSSGTTRTRNIRLRTANTRRSRPDCSVPVRRRPRRAGAGCGTNAQVSVLTANVNSTRHETGSDFSFGCFPDNMWLVDKASRGGSA
jgi:hypothetical protein